jgi:broad specificity polyphosphatase/5'/3'-nucleotidase SurE
MENTAPCLTPVLNDINVIVVSPEEASFGVAEFWSGDRQIGFTRIEDGELALRIGPSDDDVVLGTHALAEALAEANRLLALY